MPSNKTKTSILSRREMLALTGASLACPQIPSKTNNTDSPLDAILTMPNLSGHEHWGSIGSIGWRKGSFIADLKAGVEPRNTSLFDILFDPYSNMALHAAGIDPQAKARQNGYSNLQEWFHKQPKKAWLHAKEVLQPVRTTGWYHCLMQGFRILYTCPIKEWVDTDQDHVADIIELDKRVNQNYRHLMEWYQEVYKQTHIQKILRPVELSFGYQHKNPRERELMAPLLRIDKLCAFYQEESAAKQFCIDQTGIDPKNADEFREFLDKIFLAADRAGFMGTKQLQAYTRPLDFHRPRDAEVCFEKTDDKQKQKIFSNFVVFECMERTAQRQWPHQIHVGTHNLPDSNPLPLQTIIRHFPQVNFVLLHCWPFLNESAFLAKSHANVYIDPCWTPILNLSFFKKSLKTYIGYLPDNKVMIGHDSTTAEMAAGSLYHCRRVLKDVLQQKINQKTLTLDSALSLAQNYLADNARKIYSIGGEGESPDEP